MMQHSAIQNTAGQNTPSSNTASSNTAGQESRIRTSRLIVGLSVTLMLVQVGIDIVMGHEAEYFNAHATLLQLTSWLHGQSPTAPMIAGQARLGGWALPLATGVWVGLPLLVSTLLVKAGAWVARRFK